MRMRSITWFLLALAGFSTLILYLSNISSTFRDQSCNRLPNRGARQIKHSKIVQNSHYPGEGIPGRVQCSRNPQQIAQYDEQIAQFCSTDHRVSFVSLFVPPTEDMCGSSHRSYSVLQAFVESIHSTMPHSQVVILTDPDARISQLELSPGVLVEHIPGNYTRSNLMLQRLQTYIAFLDTRIATIHNDDDTPTHYIFTDSDMLIVGDVGCVFSAFTHSDVGLTFRNNKEQPINSGLILVKGTEEGLRKGKELLQNVVRTYVKDFSKASRMMGDQLAFASVIRKDIRILDRIRRDTVDSLFKKQDGFNGLVKGVKVVFLPCSLYNWTPAEGAGQFHGMPVDVRVIHFKGSRKRLMVEAWGLYGKNGDIMGLKCFVLGSGRSKYDF